MLFVLFISLLCLTFLVLYLNDGDPLAPSSLSSEVFTFCTLVALLNVNKWGVSYSAETLIVIITGLISFSVGSLLVKYGLGAKKIVLSSTKKFENYKENPIIIRTSVVVFITIIMTIITILYVKKTYEISLEMGNTGGFMTMLLYARTAYMFKDASIGNALAILGFSVNAMGYIFIFIIIYNLLFYGKKYLKWIYLLPVILFFITSAMGTGRTVFIRLITTILTILVLLWYKKKNIVRLKIVNVLKIVIGALLAIVLFYILFQLLGVFTAKTGKLSTWDMLSLYTGSSIPGFNNFLRDFLPDNHFWGSESFWSLYSTLNKFGFNFPINSNNLKFVDFYNGYSTNVYTSLRTYIYDFGYTGMLIIQFINGMLFTLFYLNLKSQNINYLFLIIYGYLNYGLAIQGIEEDSLRSFMSVTQIFELLFIVIFFNILVKNKLYSKIEES